MKVFVKFNRHTHTHIIPSILIPVIISLTFSLHSESGWKSVPSLSSFRTPLNRMYYNMDIGHVYVLYPSSSVVVSDEVRILLLLYYVYSCIWQYDNKTEQSYFGWNFSECLVFASSICDSLFTVSMLRLLCCWLFNVDCDKAIMDYGEQSK